MTRFRLETFGRLALLDDAGREDPSLATRPRKLAVLAWLAMRPGRRASRDRIIGVFWGERDEDRARNSLSDALSHLRRVLGKDAVQTVGNEIVLGGPELLDVDALEMASAAAAADHEEVVAIYKGPFLDGFYIEEAPELGDWRDRERARYASLFAKSAAIRAGALADSGAWEKCRDLSERWVDAAPDSPDAANMLLRTANSLGDRAARVKRGPKPDTPATPSEAPPRARTQRMRYAIAATAGAIAIALTLVAVRRAPALDHHRVVVLSFENRTGDAALAPFGRVVSDWLSRGLSETHAVEVVDAMSADPKATPADPRVAGREARAGIVVTGAYVRQGDSIVIDTRIVDANTGRVVRPVPSVAALASKPLDALANLRERVAGAMAAEVDPMVAALAREGSQPPTYEAYLAWVDGVDRFSHLDFAGSVEPLLRAAALDSAFISPRLWAGAAIGNMGQYVRADSVFQSLAGKRSTFAPLDRGLYDVWIAYLKGDKPGEHAAALEMLAASPGSELALYLAGLSAIKVNRPEEAARILRKIPADRSGASWNVYGTQLANALHYAERHREELAEARRRSAAVHDWLPAIADEARAFAALGDVASIDSLMKASASLPSQAGSSPGYVMYVAGSELTMHGHPREGREWYRRSVEWNRSRPESEQRGLGKRFTLARALYESGDLATADTMFRSISRDSPNSAIYLAYVGTAAAARGDTAEALRVSDALEAMTTPFLFGDRSLGRARIAAVLGRKEEAVRLLRRALSEGSDVRRIHAYPDLMRLRGYEPFDALIRPVG